MSIQTTQKIIKVGSSLAITIPAKEAKKAGWQEGDYLDVSIKKSSQPDEDDIKIVSLAQTLIKRHEQALKNLSQR